MSTLKKLIAVTVAVTIAGNNIHAVATQSGHFVGAEMYTGWSMPTWSLQWVPWLYLYKGSKVLKFEGRARTGDSEDCMSIFKRSRVIRNALDYAVEHKWRVVMACKQPGLAT